MPIRIELETHSTRLIEARFPTLVQAYRDALARAPAIRRALSGKDFRPRVDGRRLTWVASSPLAGYLTIAFAASQLQGNNWDKVSEGYTAYTAGRYEAALAAYRQALEQNPADVATRCRVGAVHQKLGQLDLARRHFAHGVDRLEEIGDALMKVWCALGLAQVALAEGDLPAAQAAAWRVLALPDVRAGHRQAREILRRSSGRR